MTRSLAADILVVGGGTAGCAAAIAAARRGHRVLLVEEANALGGTATTGGVNEWYAHLNGLGDIWQRHVEELRRYGAQYGRFFNSEYAKIVWQLLAEEANVDILFHTTLAGVEKDGARLTRAHLLACSQPLTVEARYMIDTSGEGDLAALAGAPFMKGHPQTGRTLHMTLTFILADTGRPVQPHLPAGLEEIKTQEELPGLNAHIKLPDNRVYCNMTKVMGLDPTDPLDLSRAEREARRQLARVVHYLQRTHYPTHVLVSSGARIGIREGRRIVGDYILTEEDITGDRPRDFPDGVTVATAQIDFHSLTKPGHVGWRQRVEPYAIPFRCLIAKGLSNLLMAGKCISGDQVAHSSYRMTPTCCAMGQAAGTAAALAVEGGCTDIRQVDIARLRAELARAGMELDPARHQAFAAEPSPDPTKGA